MKDEFSRTYVPSDDLTVFVEGLEAKWVFKTGVFLFRAPSLLFQGLFLQYVSRDIALRLVPVYKEDIWATLSTVFYWLGVLLMLVGASLALAASWRLNLVSKWFLLYALTAVWAFLKTSGPDVWLLAERLIIASLGAFLVELVVWLWIVRKRDSEPLYRLQSVGRVVGGISLAVVVVVLLVRF